MASLIWAAVGGYGPLLWWFVAIGTVATAVYWLAIQNNEDGETALTRQVDSAANLPPSFERR